MSKILRFMFVFSAFTYMGTNASYSDAIKKGCKDFSDISEIGVPLSENTLEIVSNDGGVESLLTVRFTGEPIAAGTWLLVHTFGEQASCHIVHSGTTAESTYPPGFNNIRLDKAFFRRNKENKSVEIFVPITEYPFASGEDYKARIVEINITKDGVVKLIN